MRATAKSKGSDINAAMPVKCDDGRYGLLYPTDPDAPEGYGTVQFGSGGPFEFTPLDNLTPVTRDEFDRWMYSH